MDGEELGRGKEGKLKILVVDDDPDFVTAVGMSIRDEFPDAEILEARDGVKAIEIYEQEKPRIVVLDMMLPRRSGTIVMEKIKPDRDSGKEPYVVFVTGNLGRRHEPYLRMLGVAEYLFKPVKMQTVVNAVKKYVPK